MTTEKERFDRLNRREAERRERFKRVEVRESTALIEAQVESNLAAFDDEGMPIGITPPPHFEAEEEAPITTPKTIAAIPGDEEKPK